MGFMKIILCAVSQNSSFDINRGHIVSLHRTLCVESVLKLDSLVIPIFSKGWITVNELCRFSETHRIAHQSTEFLRDLYKSRNQTRHGGLNGSTSTNTR